MNEIAIYLTLEEISTLRSCLAASNHTLAQKLASWAGYQGIYEPMIAEQEALLAKLNALPTSIEREHVQLVSLAEMFPWLEDGEKDGDDDFPQWLAGE